MKIQNALVSNILDRSQRYFAHVTTVTLSWGVQNIVVIGRVYFTLECFEFSSNFEFDRNMLSGMGAWPPSHQNCSVMSWHYIGTTWMSTKCQHRWNCVTLTPVTLCWHFPLATDVSKRFIQRDCFHTHCCSREQTIRALWRHRSELTRFHVDFFSGVSYWFPCKLETFRLNGYVYLCHLTNILYMYCDYFP